MSRVKHQAGSYQGRGGQDHEVEYEARNKGRFKDEVKAAVKSAGNGSEAVEEKLMD